MPEEANEFEIYRRKLEMFNAYLSPHLERITEAQHTALKGANDYAQQGLKALILLNGGAVLLAPAVKAMIGDQPSRAIPLFEGIGLFCAGLVFVLIAHLFAFYQQQSFAHQMGAEREQMLVSALLGYFPPPSEDAKAKMVKEGTDNLATATRHFNLSRCYQRGAAAMAVLSLLSFGAGSAWLLHIAMG